MSCRRLRAKRRVSDALLLALTTLGGAACDSSTEPAPQTTTSPPPAPAVTYTIQLTPDVSELLWTKDEPQSVVLSAVVRSSAGELVSQPTIIWTTDAASVATVTAAGRVTAVAVGTTTVHARYNTVVASAVINVTVPIGSATSGGMATTRVGHTATLLRDGKVLITGGVSGLNGNAGTARKSAELYDPASGTFVRISDMTTSRSHHSATLLPNGNVLIAGGVPGADPTPSAELYDPVTGTFSRTGDMRQPQSWHEATLLPNGKVLITGGFNARTSLAADPELYDPATGTFTTTTGTYAGVELMTETSGLVGIPATLLRDGRVLVASSPAAQLYDPVTNSFRRTATMVTGTSGGGAPQYIAGRTATLLENGRVLLAGGEHEDFGRFKTSELYDPSTGTFARTGDMAFVRDGHTATLLADGTVLIAGGEGSDGCDVPGCAITSMSSLETYDPAKGVFAPAGTMKVRREFHKATLLKDGRVLITGGLTFYGSSGFGGSFSVIPLASAELYDATRSASR